MVDALRVSRLLIPLVAKLGEEAEGVAGLRADGGIAYVQTFAEDPDVNERVDMAVMAKMGHRVFRGSELEDLAEANGLKLGGASHAGMVYFCTLTKKSAIGEAGK